MCAGDSKKSISNERIMLMSTITPRATYFSKLGAENYTFDFFALFTIWLLYLVEFADGDSQKTIGYGCSSNNSAPSTNSWAAKTGKTDAMPYHTGTTLSSRLSYGGSTQYRNIEELWGYYFTYVAGALFTYKYTFNVIPNINDQEQLSMNDYYNIDIRLANVATPTGYPEGFQISLAANTPIFYPSSQSSDRTQEHPLQDVIGTYYDNIRTHIWPISGGNYQQTQDNGIFCLKAQGANISELQNLYTRIMEMP